ncbi:aminopeptidase [Pseudoalteromonas sp. SMS1]|uniref:leucyl aminopeptidase family protein n=1 Tax=Pseudoalteromonas sp. SMS1 TaxID=2908894 RepID=UPI001F21F60A|nr:M17 family peptidase N-terminal domain-containing protein [Pseudoalteromonas sp. SMS1]MCF2860317.1 aminopeptidase [Pseudoalteromonas sp. SMS1]
MVRFIFALLALVFANAIQALPQVQFSPLSLEQNKHLIVFVNYEHPLSGLSAQVDQKTKGQLRLAIESAGFKGAFGETQTFYGLAPFAQITMIGAGQKMLGQSQLQDLGGYAAAATPANGQNQFAVITDSLNSQVTVPEAWVAMGAALRDYHFDKYKAQAAKSDPRHFLIQSHDYKTAAKKYDNDLRYIVKGVHLTRDMASEPGKGIYPQSFVKRVKEAFDGIDNVDIDVLNVRDMKKRGMGAILGVGLGSIHEPRMLVIHYRGSAKKAAPIALVGKGITFDTGGISLKKNSGMWQMKSDLSGAAAVAGALLAVASRGENVNLVGVMPLAENMPAEDAIRPGDVLTTMQGTTIEIISTDAEGRLLLADAVRYTQDEFKPKMLVNIATLTGSAARALSDEYAAMITRDWSLAQRMMSVGEISGEAVWPLPLHPNFFKQIKSDIADIKNSGAGNPGASIGAAVVATFVDEDLPWVHLDIAGVDWLNHPIAIAPKGSQGWGVRFLDQVVRDNLSQ